MYIHVIAVSWFLQCMGEIPREGCMYFRRKEEHTARGRYYSMHCKNNETADLTVKANRQISFGARMSILLYVLCASCTV